MSHRRAGLREKVQFPPLHQVCPSLAIFLHTVSQSMVSVSMSFVQLLPVRQLMFQCRDNFTVGAMGQSLLPSVCPAPEAFIVGSPSF